MWDCTGCGEKHEDTFDICWNCGTPKDGGTDPSRERSVAEEGPGITAEVPRDAPVVSGELRTDAGPVCPRCGSQDVIPDVRIVDRGDGNFKRDLQVEVYESPGALLFKGTHAGVLRASICGRCGHAELSVTNPGELLAAYRQSLGS